MTIANNETFEWRPVSREQERFLSSPADEALFGGAAGAGKSDCLVIEALRQIYHPRFNGIIFRRTFPMLEGADGIIARTKIWYPAFGGSYNSSRHVWTFPSGAKIFLGHLEHEDDVTIYQSWQLQYIAFDELTHFTQFQYLYMFSRNRADVDSGLRCYIRNGTNPGGIGHEWVKKRFITSGVTNKIGYFTKVNNKDTRVEKSHPDAKSRTFIPAKVTSNPKISRDYLTNLRQLDEVDRQRLEDGDWDAGSLEDRIYPYWSHEENVTIEADYDPAYPVYWTVDDGFSNPRVILLLQERPCQGKPDRICVFQEYYKTLQLANNSIKEVIEWGYPVPEMVYYDPESPQFAAECHTFGLTTRRAFNKIHEGVKVVRRFILSHNGERLLQVHPRCERLIEAIPAYQKDKKNVKGGDPEPLKDGNDHPCDALRYYIASKWWTPQDAN